MQPCFCTLWELTQYAEDKLLRFFKNINCSFPCFVLQVFRPRTPPEAIALCSRLLEYTPTARLTPLEACAHSFFDELRDPNVKLPNGRDTPALFNFTTQGNFTIYLQGSISLPVTIVKFLLCLIYKLNCLIGMCVYKKNIVYVGFGTVLSFRHPLQVLEHIPVGKEGLL